MQRQLETDVYRLKADAYRIMEAPKLISLQKKERIGSRMIDKYVEVSSRSENGVAVSVNVDVNVVVSTKNSREPECTEWQTIYVSASSKSSKSEAKSGKGSKSMKGGKSGKDSSKSAKLIPVRKCIATRAPPTEKPSQETALLVTPNPLEPTVSNIILNSFRLLKHAHGIIYHSMERHHSPMPNLAQHPYQP